MQYIFFDTDNSYLRCWKLMKSDCHAQYNSTTTIIANVYFKWSVEIYISTSQLNTMERVVEFGTEQKFDFIYAT